MNAGWYEQFFSGVALDLWQEVCTPEQTSNEIEMIDSLFDLKRGARILDIPCGLGRHMLALMERGYCVTGVDGSDEALARLRLESARQGIEAEIVDLRTLRPLDMEPVLDSFKKTNRAVIVEEGWKSYGVGAEVSSRIYEQAFDHVDAPILRVAQKEVPLPYNRTLEQSALPQVPDVVEAVKEVLR